MLGVMLTDINLCFKSVNFKKQQVVSASINGLQLHHHTFSAVQFSDFCHALFKLEVNVRF